MRTLTNVLVGLVAGGVLTGLACSGSLDGYDTGTTSGSGTGASGSTSGHGGATASSTSAVTSSGGADTGPSSSSTAMSTTTGTTTPPCPMMCNNTCTDTTQDPENCGACGTTCSTGYQCLDSVCGNVVVDASTLLATCAVLKAGEVWCWGRDVYGEIGVPSTDPANAPFYKGDRSRVAPAKVAGVSGAVQVVAGRQATCALTGSGQVWCWGSNLDGLLGHDPGTDPMCVMGTGGTSPPSGPCSPTPQPVLFNPPVVVTQIAMGTVNACALTSTHDVWCWGRNGSGQIASPPSGIAPSGDVVKAPVKNANVSGNADEVAVSNDIDAWSNAICVRRSAAPHEVDCWGGAQGGSLFPATANHALCAGGSDDYCTPHATPVPAVFASPGGTLVDADALSLGIEVGIVLQGGKAFTWGTNFYGQGASTSMASHFDLKPLLSTNTFSAVSATGLTTSLLATDGTVWTVGWSDNGQIGNGVKNLGNGTCPNPNTTGQGCQLTAVQIPPSSLSGVSKMMSGTFGSLAVTTAGKLYVWGANANAALGHTPGTMGDVNCGAPAPATPLPCADVPVLVDGLP